MTNAGDYQIEASDFEWLVGYLNEEELAPPVPVSPEAPLPTSPSADSAPGSLDGVTLKPIEALRPIADSAPLRKAEWKPDEDLTILAAFRRLGTQWGRIAASLPDRTADGVRNRWHRLQRRHGLALSDSGGDGRRKLDELLDSCGIGPDWMPPVDPQTAEDELHIKGFDHGRTMWTSEEDSIIREGVRLHGFRWRQIAASLPGRSDSSVRNRWRRLEKEPDDSFASSGSSSEGEASEPAVRLPRKRPRAAGVPTAKAGASPLFAAPPAAAAAAKPPELGLAVPLPWHARPASVRVDSIDLLDCVGEAFNKSDWSPFMELARSLEDSFETQEGRLEPKPPARNVSMQSERSSASTTTAADDDSEEEGEEEDGGTATGGRKRYRPMWTGEEGRFIVSYVEKHGRQWSKIAEQMPGRSHRAVRNRWLRMQKGQATRQQRGPDSGYRCRACGELKLGHICSASIKFGAIPAIPITHGRSMEI